MTKVYSVRQPRFLAKHYRQERTSNVGFAKMEADGSWNSATSLILERWWQL